MSALLISTAQKRSFWIFKRWKTGYEILSSRLKLTKKTRVKCLRVLHFFGTSNQFSASHFLKIKTTISICDLFLTNYRPWFWTFPPKITFPSEFRILWDICSTEKISLPYFRKAFCKSISKLRYFRNFKLGTRIAIWERFKILRTRSDVRNWRKISVSCFLLQTKSRYQKLILK